MYIYRLFYFNIIIFNITFNIIYNIDRKKTKIMLNILILSIISNIYI